MAKNFDESTHRVPPEHTDWQDDPQAFTERGAPLWYDFEKCPCDCARLGKTLTHTAGGPSDYVFYRWSCNTCGESIYAFKEG